MIYTPTALLVLGLLGLADHGLAVSLNASDAYTSGSLGASPYQTFYSSSSTPVEWNFNVAPSLSTPANEYYFLSPRGSDVKKYGAYIFDGSGEMVWDGSAWGQTMTFSVETYQGEPVLAIWTGAFNAGGWGDGKQVLLDTSYRNIANVSTTLTNQTNDFHEFRITSNNTALITVYAVQQYDLASYNVTATDGSTGWILDCYFQEIDIANGSAVFTWNALEHVDPSLCYANPGTTGTADDNPWDYFHINSIDKDAAGNYLISSRHCHALYYVSGSDGTILWSIGGMNSTFTIGDGANFEWQHDARWQSDQAQISVFDNAATNWESDETSARGLLLNVNMDNKSVTLAQEWLPWNQTVSVSQGSVQLLDDGNWLAGWGSQPWLSEYAANGTLLWAAQLGLPPNVQNYRAMRYTWYGSPNTAPNISYVPANTTLYASWSGATNVSTWEVMGYASSGNTSLVNATKSGFETAVTLSDVSSYAGLYAVARDSSGSVLGTSGLVSINGTSLSSGSSSTGSSDNSTSSSSSGSSAGLREACLSSGGGLVMLGLVSGLTTLL